MKSFVKLMFLLIVTFTLTACIGEEYDFTPPTITLEDYPIQEELIEATLNWRGENNEPIRKTTEDIFSFAEAQPLLTFNSDQQVDIVFDSQDFEIVELKVSLWKNNEEMKLTISDDRTFKFPQETGDYVMVVDLHSDRGIAQYVGNIIIQ